MDTSWGTCPSMPVCASRCRGHASSFPPGRQLAGHRYSRKEQRDRSPALFGLANQRISRRHKQPVISKRSQSGSAECVATIPREAISRPGLGAQVGAMEQLRRLIPANPGDRLDQGEELYVLSNQQTVSHSLCSSTLVFINAASPYCGAARHLRLRQRAIAPVGPHRPLASACK